MIITSFLFCMFNPILNWYWAFGWMTSIEYQTLFVFTFFSDSFFPRKMGFQFLEGCCCFGTELSVGLDPQLFFISLFFSDFCFFWKMGHYFLGVEEQIKGLGYQLGWSLKQINLRMRIGTNFFNIMLKKLVLSLIIKLISLRLQPNC